MKLVASPPWLGTRVGDGRIQCWWWEQRSVNPSAAGREGSSQWFVSSGEERKVMVVESRLNVEERKKRKAKKKDKNRRGGGCVRPTTYTRLARELFSWGQSGVRAGRTFGRRPSPNRFPYGKRLYPAHRLSLPPVAHAACGPFFLVAPSRLSAHPGPHATPSFPLS